ncbi:hypothetical protein RT723_01745 [Psychrosphaera aquimarina]|uniref:Uncharacterized protein n=1 Tax=Psychrosphaera aquimarina TaxID=2044854 RepID=A0ABU3QWD8_9GAMM|nr:hypothetical protein [Psychrosphaera aquimarina]MDU0111752.1 hypothetical protein [Psychrosphaera aquimarina]
MDKISIYTQSLQKLVDNNTVIIPENVYSDDKTTLAGWGEPIWLEFNPQKKCYERFMFCRSDPDTNDKSPLKAPLSRDYTVLLQVYFIEQIINKNVSTGQKQALIRTARQMLTIAESYEELNCLSKNDYEKLAKKQGLIFFWQFCKDNKFLSGVKPKTIDNRDRYASTRIHEKQEKFKKTPLSIITAIAEIYHEVFRYVNEDGTIIDGKEVRLKDALPITFAIFGLATPSRLSVEIPYLLNQKLKSSKTKNGKKIYYLDWPGSKKYQDNSSHILAVMAPIINKILNFYSVQFKPNRYFIRFLKNPLGTWKYLLKGFDVDPERQANIDFKMKPNIFTFSYAIGYYPVDHEIMILNDSELIIEDSTVRGGFRFYKKLLRARMPKSKRVRGLVIKHSDFYTRKSIGLLDSNDLIALDGFQNQSSALLTPGRHLTHTLDKIINLNDLNYIKRHTTIDSLSKVIIDSSKGDFSNFPYSSIYQSTRMIDLEDALFCINPKYKANFTTTGMGGTIFKLLSVANIKVLFNNPFKDLTFKSYGKKEINTIFSKLTVTAG